MDLVGVGDHVTLVTYEAGEPTKEGVNLGREQRAARRGATLASATS